MKALRISGERQITVLDSPMPKAESGEVVLRMKATGICGSDLHPYRHPSPQHLDPGFVSGHEPCGVIHELGAGVEGWSVGDPVVVYFRRTCGQCRYCRMGRRNVCVNRRASYGHQGLDGSHTEFMRVEAPCLMRLPEHLSFVDGAILACQAGTAYYPLSRLGVSGRDVLVVSGLGPVGLLAVLFAKAMGATIVGVDPSAGRRELAQQLGAATTLDPTDGPIGEQLGASYSGGADKLIETSGSPAAHAAIGDLLRPLGAAALVGLGTAELKMPLMRLVHKELTIFGTSIYPDRQFDEICQFLKRHDIRLSSIVSHRFSLDEGPEAFETAASATSGKVCFGFDGAP
jgi:threonine dehydrogenase-like Zn-dependent dehydrogenase